MKNVKNIVKNVKNMKNMHFRIAAAVGAGAALAVAGPSVASGQSQGPRGSCEPAFDYDIAQPGLSGATVYSFALFDDDGNGTDLYAGGIFNRGNGVPLGGGIGRWDGQEWSHVGFGVAGSTGADLFVRDMVVWDDGTGPVLYCGGNFSHAGFDTEVNNIAKWDGTQWSALGGGLTAMGLGGPMNGYVNALAVYDDGTGPALYAAGSFNTIDGEWLYGESTPTIGVAKWDGKAWSPVGQYGDTPRAFDLVVYDDGTGEKLYAIGSGTAACDCSLSSWDGTQWTTIARDSEGPNWHSGLVWDDGTGEKLYLGGNSTPGVRVYDGTSIEPVGTLAGFFFDIFVFDDGSGEKLYAAKKFGVHSWDGSSWTQVADISGGASEGLSLISDQQGLVSGTPTLYIGGNYSNVQGQTASNIVAYEGCPDGPPPCPADLTGDGTLNFFDVSAFLSAFNNMQPDGDFNDDGNFNFFDVSAFLSAFNAGCP